jgi:hypothetical protein
MDQKRGTDGGGGSRRFGSHGRMCVTGDHSLSLLDSMIHDFSFPFVAFHLFERFHEIESIDISLGIFHSFLSRDLFERIAALFHSFSGGRNKQRTRGTVKCFGQRSGWSPLEHTHLTFDRRGFQGENVHFSSDKCIQVVRQDD